MSLPSATRVKRLLDDGTGHIVAGTLVAGIAAYAYEVVAGRTLGAERFAPVSVLLTLHFLALVVVLLPLEQLVIRMTTLEAEDGAARRLVIGVTVSTAVVAGLAAYLARAALFDGDASYAVITAASVLTHGVFVVGRGRLAGRSRYREYGLASGSAAVVRLAAVVAVVALSASGPAVGWTLVLGPVVILAWWPSQALTRAAPGAVRAESRFLGGLVVASAASQLLLLGGPVVAGIAGVPAAEISALFVTITLFRGPLALGHSLAARVLPPLTRMATAAERELRRWGLGLAVAGIVAALASAGLAAWWGPGLVGLFFGDEFRPDGAVAGLVGAGVVLSGGALLSGEVLVARSATGRLAVAWLAGVFAATVTLFVFGSGVTQIAGAFVVGEVVAVAWIAAGILGRPRRDGLTYRGAKRVMDLAVASTLLLLTLPIQALIGVAIRRETGGPVWFRQDRVGRNGQIFRLLKLRTMPPGADDAFDAHLARLAADPAAALRIEDDPRLGRVGRLVRACGLDELPNLWNVLVGDLSLVGPRPLVPAEAALLGSRAEMRHRVRPGITGLAQVLGRDEISAEDRLRADVLYVAERSLALDLAILLRTVPAMMGSPWRSRLIRVSPPR